jgi:hypothetical protein
MYSIIYPSQKTVSPSIGLYGTKVLSSPLLRLLWVHIHITTAKFISLFKHDISRSPFRQSDLLLAEEARLDFQHRKADYFPFVCTSEMAVGSIQQWTPEGSFPGMTLTT